MSSGDEQAAWHHQDYCCRSSQATHVVFASMLKQAKAALCVTARPSLTSPVTCMLFQLCQVSPLCPTILCCPGGMLHNIRTALSTTDPELTPFVAKGPPLTCSLSNAPLRIMLYAFQQRASSHLQACELCLLGCLQWLPCAPPFCCHVSCVPSWHAPHPPC
jgi:hypothetical protein